jgi:hypothetical protein
MCGVLPQARLLMQESDTLTWDSLRAFALSLQLPNVEDAISWGQPNLKAHGKMWVWWSPQENAPVFKTTFEEREFLIEVDPETFFFTPHYKSWPLILARPDKVDLEWVRANLIRTWRNQAKKTFLKKWDSEHM